jgi:hypothetical protein
MCESDSAPRSEESYRSGVLYARRRYIPFKSEHPLVDLVVPSDLAAADNTALAIVATGPPETNMAADIEPTPIVKDGQRRSIGRRPSGIGGVSRSLRRDQRRCNAADCQESVHCIVPRFVNCLRAQGSNRSGPYNADCALYLFAKAVSETVWSECNLGR